MPSTMLPVRARPVQLESPATGGANHHLLAAAELHLLEPADRHLLVDRQAG
jgi:hypothetical protein